MTKFATPEEIQYAYSVLFKNTDNNFEPDKIEIIECNESRDVKACPGSGKTTTLLAKLIILANRMPLPDNQGICVLTHTNVAIDEIKNKLGHKANILFKYPNHFGTIQSFVDKFLAIPALKKYFSSGVRKIDNDAANKYILSEFKRLNEYEDKLHKFLYMRFYEKNSLITNEDISIWETKTGDNMIKQKLISTGILIEKGEKRVKNFYLDSKKSNWKQLCQLIQDKNICKIVYEKRKETNKSIEIEKDKFILNLKLSYINKTIKHDFYSFSSQSESGQSFVKLKENSFSKGILSFYDAYCLAFRYCFDNKENLKKAFSSRFKYIFIDEMQDTDSHQLDIVEAIFDLEKSIIQCFGDQNQAIFNNELWQPTNVLKIDESKRFGENIAKVLRYVCPEKNDELRANPNINSLPPTIIVFDNPLNVLPKFCELLQTKKIGSKTIWSKAIEERIITGNFSHKIKAIGWVGNSDNSNRPVDNLTIKSYFNNFNSNVKKKEKVDYDSLKSFLRRQDGSKVKDYLNTIIEALLRILSIANIRYSKGETTRNYTKTSLLDFFSNKSPGIFQLFNANIAKWAKNIHNSDGFCDITINEIKEFITTIFCPIFEIDSTNQDISQFLNNSSTNVVAIDELKSNNIFKQNEIEVEVATIHSVKGETHVATLYLETSYYEKHESQIIMEQLNKEYYQLPEDNERKKESLRIAYVGMSRPKYFLCVAINRSRFNEILDINNGGMWEIVYA